MSTKARFISFQFSTTQAYILEFGPTYIRFYYDIGSGGGQITDGGLPVEKITTYAETELFDIKTWQTADVLYIAHPSHPLATLTRTSHILWTLVDVSCKGEAPKYITNITNTAPPTVKSLAHGYNNGDELKFEDIIGMVELNGGNYYVGNKTADTFDLYQNSALNLPHDFTGINFYIAGGITIRALANAAAIFNTTNHYPSCGCFYEQRLWLGGFNLDPAFYGSRSGDYTNFIEDPELDDGAISYTPVVSDKVDRIRWMVGQEVLMMGTFGGILKVSSSSLNEPITPTNITVKKQLNLGVKNIQPQLVSDAILWVTRLGRALRQLSFDDLSQKWTAPDFTRLAKHIAVGTTNATSGIVEMAFQTEPVPILWAIRTDGQLLGLTYDTQEKVYAWFRIVTDGLFESVAVMSVDNQEDQVWVVVNRTIGGVSYRYIEYFKPHEIFGVIEDSFFVHSGLSYAGSTFTITDITVAAGVVTVTVSETITFENASKVRIKGVLGMTEVNQDYTAQYTVANHGHAPETFQLSGIDGSAWTPRTGGGTVYVVKNAFAAPELLHLALETVDALIDGVVDHGLVVTAAGAITALTYYGNKIHIGLPFRSIVEPMYLNVNTEQGTSQGKKQRISKVTGMFYQTGTGVQWGPDLNNLKDILANELDVNENPIYENELFTDSIDTQFDSDWETQAPICIVQDDPLPMTILGLVPRLNIDNED